MELEQERVGEPTHVAEPTLGPRPVGFGDARLTGRGHDAGHEAQEDQRGPRHRRPVTAGELRSAVAEGVRARAHREAFEVPSKVLGQLERREIASLGLLAQRLQDDGVEIAAQLARRGPRSRHVARGGRCFATVLGAGGSVSQTECTMSSREPLRTV